MGTCQLCERNMAQADGCADYTLRFCGDEETYPAPWNGQQGQPAGDCHDCGAAVRKPHHPHCDQARCPRCEGQLLACSCPSFAYVTESMVYIMERYGDEMLPYDEWDEAEGTVWDVRIDDGTDEFASTEIVGTYSDREAAVNANAEYDDDFFATVTERGVKDPESAAE